MLLGLGGEWEITELGFDREPGEVRLRIEATAGLFEKEKCTEDGGTVSASSCRYGDEKQDLAGQRFGLDYSRS